MSMKGFGGSNKNIKKSTNQKLQFQEKDKLLSKAFALHSKGEIKEAAKIYDSLIRNKHFDPRIFNNLGTIYIQLKDFDKAITLFEKSIEKFPASLEPYSNLASILLNIGRIDIAKKYLKKAIDINPKFLKAYSILANIYVKEGDLKRAEFCFKKSIEINPKDINSLVNLACVLKDLGNSLQAEPFLRKAIAINPDNENALINLGAVLNELGRIEEAEEFLKKALRTNPISPIALNNLGNILSKKNNLEDAEICFRKAIKIKSNFSLAYNNLGSLLSKKGNLFEAEKFTKEAIKINPKFELAYVNLGSIKIDLDKLTEAEELFLSAIKIRNNYSYAYSNLFRLYEKTNKIDKLKSKIETLNDNLQIINEILMYKARIAFREKDYTTAKKLIDQVNTEWINQTDHHTNLLFWSFKAFIEEKVGNYDEAFRCFEKSQLNLKYKNCNPKIFQDYIRIYRKNLDSKKYLEKKIIINKSEFPPTFLIGFPRSGTTLLDTILRSHPDIDVLEEKPIINSVEQIIKSKYKYSLDELGKLTESEIDFLRKYYLETLKNNCNKDKNAKILIDKFPFQTVCLPLINLLFPNAKIIFTHRNPYDTVLSCFQQSFEPNNAMSNFRSIDSAAEIYDLTMNMWLDYKNKLNIEFITSKYEDLVEDFENNILRILNFLDISWNKNIKNYRKTAYEREKINTPSSSQVIQPIYKTSIEKWKNYDKYFKNSHKYLKRWKNYFEYL